MSQGKRKKLPRVTSAPQIEIQDQDVNGYVSIQMIVAKGEVYVQATFALRREYADRQATLPEAMTEQVDAAAQALADHLGCKVHQGGLGAVLSGPTVSASSGRA